MPALRFLFFLSILSSALCKEFNFCSKQSSDYVYNGHCGHYRQNFSEYPVDNPLGHKIIAKKAIEFLMVPKTPEMRLMIVEAHPYLYVNRDEDGFSMWGPLYSICFEAAKYANYSIEAATVDREDRHLAFVKFKPDFLVTLLWPQLDYVRILFDQDGFGLAKYGISSIAWLTQIIGTVEYDHVLYLKRTHSRDRFIFMKTFDMFTWFALLSSSFGLALVVSVLTKPKPKRTSLGRWIPDHNPDTNKLNICKESFKQLFWTTTAIVAMSTNPINLKSSNSPRISAFVGYLILPWLTVTLLLRNLFGGDMFAGLTMDPKPDVIDSLEDLVGNSISIWAIDTNIEVTEETRKNYFNPTAPYYSDLTSRLQFFDFTLIRDYPKRFELMFGDDVSNPETDSCMISLRSTLQYAREDTLNGKYRDVTHVSREGAGAQPHAFARLYPADSVEGAAMEIVLRESGVYQKWLDVAIFGKFNHKEKRSLVAYKPGKFGNFEGPILICFGLVGIACLVLFCELLFKKMHSKRRAILRKRKIVALITKIKRK